MNDTHLTSNTRWAVPAERDASIPRATRSERMRLLHEVSPALAEHAARIDRLNPHERQLIQDWIRRRTLRMAVKRVLRAAYLARKLPSPST